MEKRNTILIIEGTTDTTNGDLRQAFARLLEQKITYNKPRIIMGNGKNQAIDKFKNQPTVKIPFLLIDLDTDETQRETVIRENKLNGDTESVFFMVQEMESWFLSQPALLQRYYSQDLTEKIKRSPAEIPNPCNFLQEITRSTKKGSYHKTKHGVELLPKLNLNTLCADFSDVNKLIHQLLT